MANQFSSCFEKLIFYPSFKNDENDFLFTVIHFLVARKQITCSKATKIINFAASNSSLTLSFPYQIVFCFDGKWKNAGAISIGVDFLPSERSFLIL